MLEGKRNSPPLPPSQGITDALSEGRRQGQLPSSSSNRRPTELRLDGVGETVECENASQ